MRCLLASPFLSSDRDMRFNELGGRLRISAVGQMRRKDDRKAIADQIVCHAVGDDLAGVDVGECLTVIGVAEEDLCFSLLVLFFSSLCLRSRCVRSLRSLCVNLPLRKPSRRWQQVGQRPRDERPGHLDCGQVSMDERN